MDTLLEYGLSAEVRAFSTTRISPFRPTPEEIKEMGAYAAFNVTHYCGDEEARVMRNRVWLCKQIGITESALVIPRQTHTANVQRIGRQFMRMSEEERRAALQDVDALVTDLPDVCIGVSTADCVPVLLYDEENQATAAIHSGWRGTVSRIAVNTLAEMQAAYGTKPGKLKAVVAPCISPEVYEVGEEVAQQFEDAAFPGTVIIRKRTVTGKPHIDLRAANVWLLEGCGVPLENIRVCNCCTFLQADTFFSARKLGINSGRMFTGICRHGSGRNH